MEERKDGIKEGQKIKEDQKRKVKETKKAVKIKDM